MMIERSFFPSAILDAPAYQRRVDTRHFRRARLMLVAMCWVLLELTFMTATWSKQLPAQYFRLLEAGIAQVGKQMGTQPAPNLEALSARPGWKRFPQSILAAAVLYAKKHPANAHYRDPKMLSLAIRIGDLLAVECEKNHSETCFEEEWDVHMWLEAYRLIATQLGEERRVRWRRSIEAEVTPLASDAMKRQDFPWYNTPYIGTSPNHFASWAALMLLFGRVFGNKNWENLGERILHRFAAEEQAPDG